MLIKNNFNIILKKNHEIVNSFGTLVKYVCRLFIEKEKGLQDNF